MKFYTAVTDNRWYRFLAARPYLREVNFWHPGGTAPFSHAELGTPFLFKLKSPNHHIGGGGYFVKYESLPLTLAWEAFGEGNGASSFGEFSDLINSSRRAGDPFREVGCSILSEPFFFAESDWIAMSADFPTNVVRGKFFDSREESGARIWDQISRTPHLDTRPELVSYESPQYGEPRLYKPRVGQGAFRALVTNAYQRKCAFTGESTLPVLEAAHIRPFSNEGPNLTRNGLLLRSDFHKLFDIGLMTVTPQLRIVVSDRIRDLWYNGKAYNRLHGNELASIPSSKADMPDRDLLRWHNDHVFEKENRSA